MTENEERLKKIEDWNKWLKIRAKFEDIVVNDLGFKEKHIQFIPYYRIREMQKKGKSRFYRNDEVHKLWTIFNEMRNEARKMRSKNGNSN